MPGNFLLLLPINCSDYFKTKLTWHKIIKQGKSVIPLSTGNCKVSLTVDYDECLCDRVLNLNGQ